MCSLKSLEISRGASTDSYDLIVIGGGLVGLATAYQYLEKRPGSGVLLLEKESDVCLHQSGRNSGVIHSGIYYKPGSQKAINCRKGKALLEQFCTEHNLPWKRTGKVIVACDETEVPALERLLERGLANAVDVRRITPQELHEIEPAVSGVAALHVPETGVVDFKAVAARLCELIRQKGGKILCSARVTAIREEVASHTVVSSQGEFEARALVNCGGLYSDHILRMCSQLSQYKIVPFRGEYFYLTEQAAQLCRSLVYPVPNPEFPFLGVHFTRGVHGEVDCGPNAVLAFAREGYSLGRINPAELLETLAYPGLQKLLLKHWRYAIKEISQSFCKSLFVKSARRLIPGISAKDLIPAPAGVRAQAVSRDGKPVDDFVIERTGTAVHVLNAPSPAATSCLSIGKSISELVA